jgi:hypothetical protein
MPKTYKHDPQDKADYTWNFGDLVPVGDEIASYTLTPEAGITYYDDSKHASPTTGEPNAAVTAWVRRDGGAVNARLGITCHVVTVDGREFDRTMYFLLLEQ